MMRPIMQLFIGTSGWIYRDWVGPFYPKGLPDIDKLAFYAEHFKTVEINSTFYHMPQAKSVQRWYDAVPPDFTYAVKLNRYLTHTKHLLPDAAFDEALGQFLEVLTPLKEKLGVVLVQLPPSLRLDLSRIEHLQADVQQFEQKLDMVFPLAIEFRHVSWFTPDVFAMLKQLNLATVTIDSPGRWPATRTITGDTAYIRFHGHTQLYRSSYSDQELVEWLTFLKREGKDCKRAFLYFNNDYEGVAVANAQSLLRLIQEVA